MKVVGANMMSFFEAAVLRYRHDLVTGEFVNFGLAYVEDGDPRVYCVEDWSRLSAFFPKASTAQIERVVASVERCLEIVYSSSKPTTLKDALAGVLVDPCTSVVAEHHMTGVTAPGCQGSELFARYAGANSGPYRIWRMGD